jgi:hypothetical protein
VALSEGEAHQFEVPDGVREVSGGLPTIDSRVTPGRLWESARDTLPEQTKARGSPIRGAYLHDPDRGVPAGL